MSLTAKQALERLSLCATQNRLAHAYCIVAPVEASEKALIEPWLTGLLGSSPGTHPDVNHLQPESKSRWITVEQVRDVIGKLYQTSMLGGWKAAIIHEADRLRPEAANAFLKTLEEPPQRTLLLLLTARPEQMLTTILSRCLTLRLRGLDDSSPPAALAPVLQDFATGPKLKQKGASGAAVVRAYQALSGLTAYLASVKEQYGVESKERLKQARSEGVTSEGLEDLEKQLSAQAETEYVGMRRQVLRWLILSLPAEQRNAAALVEDAAGALTRNVREDLVLERLYLQRFTR